MSQEMGRELSKEPHIHSVILQLCEPAPAEVAIAGEVSLKLKLDCAQGCELGGLPLAIVGADGRELARVPPATDAFRTVTLKAPGEVGEQRWSVQFPPHEHAGVRHEACALALAFKTLPHTTSLAVWAVPSPVVIGERFGVKVGAKSSAGQALAGLGIAVSDASGAIVGRSLLHDTPWPGTSALYWAEVELPTPAQEGLSWYTANFAATDAADPHDGSAAKFSVAVVRPAEHRLIVTVFDKDTRAPITEAQIRIGPHGAATDASGRAEVALPKGSYELSVWKAGYDVPARPIDISADARIEVEAAALPPENPYAPWEP
jgi:hypothetical protein